MIGTLLDAAVITAAIHLARQHASAIREVWGRARWYERVVLCACLLPIPGPVDELAGLLVVRRILARGKP